MYQQVLTEAPWIDAIVRGEGEDIFVDLLHALAGGEDRGPAQDQWPRLSRGRKSWRRRPRRRSRISTRSSPDWSVLEWTSTLTSPWENAGGDPQHGARLPLHLQLLLAMEVLARLPHSRPQAGRRRDREPDAAPRYRLLHPSRRGTDHQQKEVHSVLRRTDPARPQQFSGASTPASPTSCATRRCCRSIARRA